MNKEVKLKKLIFVLLALVVLLAAAGCGASSEKSVYPVTSTMTKTSNYQDSSKGGIYPPTTVITMPPATSTRITLGQAPTTTSAGPAWDNSTGYSADYSTQERMVIKTANMALVVEDVNISLQQITNLAKSNGGYVISSDIQENNSRLYANISFRVEASKFDATMQALQNLAVDVKSISTSGQDVTEEYVDLNSKLGNLEASEAQLLKLMEKAGTVEEILKVQQQLVSTRGDIEVIKGRMQYLEQSSALSYIYASLEQSKLGVEFFANTTTIKEGENAQFQPTVSGGFSPYTFTWDFGDGKTSTEETPSHVYNKAGIYTVKLSIKDDKQNTVDATREDYITVTAGWTAGNVAQSAWHGMVAFGRFLASFFIGLGIFSPVWIAVLVILYFAWWRRRKKKS
jgi:PKD repeat protein